MKKLLKLSLIIVSIFLLLSQSYCYATNNIAEPTASNEMQGDGIPADWARSFDPNASEEDMLLDGAFETLYSSNEDDGIMPISDDIELPENVIDNDVYLCEESISIENEVNGNVYLIAKNINISSEYLNGNVFAIGQDVTIKGLVYGSIYVMGENINIESECTGTVYVLGKNVTLAENATILGDLKVSADNLYINGNVNRELDAYVENINVSDKSENIGKGYVSYSTELVDPKGMLEALEVQVHEKTSEKAQGLKEVISISKVQSEVVAVISTIIIIGIIYLIIKNRPIEKVENYTQEILAGVGKGFLWLIATPIVSVILLCTIIGIPVALLAITIYIIAICISLPVASLRIAEIIFANKPKDNKLTLLLYAIAVYVVIKVVSYLPIIGGIISFLVGLYGIESIVKYIFPSKNKKSKSENEVISE